MVNRNKERKRTARAGAVVLGTTLLMMTASPAALADVRRDDGDDPGPGLSAFETMAYFVAAPILLYVLIAVLVVVGERTAARRVANSGG